MRESELVHNEALRIGFDRCGIALCRPLEELRPKIEAWLAAGHHGGLEYMQRNLDKRLDPTVLVPGARSVVVCALSYKRAPAPVSSPLARIASYAWGRDYHAVLKEKLHELFGYMHQLRSSLQGRVFVDTAPLLEKAWAVEAGLGWIGRHSLLTLPDLGSFVVLGCIVSDFDFYAEELQHPTLSDRCGACHACLDACPAGAIQPDRTIDASRCIARLTIEKTTKEAPLHGWIFGCDQCQQACPHNRTAPLATTTAFTPVEGIEQMTDTEWLNLTPEAFRSRFGDTPLSRCGLERLQQHLRQTPTSSLAKK